MATDVSRDGVGAARDDGPPLPEALLVPLLDAAGELLRNLDDDQVPKALRPLAGFDRRGLARGAARQQLQRVLDHDDDFRAAVTEAFLAQPEVAHALEDWDPATATATAAAAAERDDLPLLASALHAGRPAGWQFGLGVVCAAAERRRSERESEAEASARDARLASLEEARDRAEEARTRLERDVKGLEDDLRTERRSRREREDRARRAAEAAEQRLESVRAEAERVAEAHREAERARERLRERLDAQEGELRAARAAAREPGRGPALRREDLETLTDAATLARRLAAGLEGVAGHARRHMPDAEPAATASPPSTRRTRARVPVPRGLVLDTPPGLEAAMREPGVVLLVDGYNVSMRAWGGAQVTEQRERLIAALAGLQVRTRAAVTVVFDGATVGAPPARRPGVRVVFSPEGVEADAVVVREVEGLALDVPAIVVSSDRWVQEHAGAAGAGVVASSTLLAMLGT